ncbi:YqhA family protein [Aureimonas altamirensis]|uniref:YqhA family protein n=1 Tax=Aureimonas altamirensis TaxID=370622 RepID=UPI0025562955|nr:YqhA family protein [Aureimonas altamirensis]
MEFQEGRSLIRKVFAASRYMLIIPVIITPGCSLFLMLHQSVSIIMTAFRMSEFLGGHSGDTKLLAIQVIEAVDVFLISIAVYIISIGLYSLFVDDKAPLPKWLIISNLDDLKDHLVSVVIAVLSVLFLKEAVAWDGNRDILHLGAAIGLVLVPLVFYLSINRNKQ